MVYFHQSPAKMSLVLLSALITLRIAHGLPNSHFSQMFSVLNSTKMLINLATNHTGNKAQLLLEGATEHNPFPGDCGRSTYELQTFRNRFKRIVGGTVAEANSLPWIVSIRGGRVKHSHYCGGTLVRVNRKVDASDIVITAAQCVRRRLSTMHVYLGSHWRNGKMVGEQQVDVSKVVKYPSYKHITRWNADKMPVNDIAVIRLARPVKFTKTIQPACLPGQYENIPLGLKGIVAGWGSTKVTGNRNRGAPSDVLNKVELPIVPPRFCGWWYKPQNGIDLINPETMLCAGYEAGGMDTCHMDNGGPYVFGKREEKEGPVRYTLQGIVSWGDGCGTPFGIYTRVTGFSTWIQQTIMNMTTIRG